MKEVILVPLCSAVDLERLCDNAIAELKKDKKKVKNTTKTKKPYFQSKEYRDYIKSLLLAGLL